MLNKNLEALTANNNAGLLVAGSRKQEPGLDEIGVENRHQAYFGNFPGNGVKAAGDLDGDGTTDVLVWNE